MRISPFVQVELWAIFIKEVGGVVSLALSDRPHLAGLCRLYLTVEVLVSAAAGRVRIKRPLVLVNSSFRVTPSFS